MGLLAVSITTVFLAGQQLGGQISIFGVVSTQSTKVVVLVAFGWSSVLGQDGGLGHPVASGVSEPDAPYDCVGNLEDLSSWHQSCVDFRYIPFDSIVGIRCNLWH